MAPGVARYQYIFAFGLCAIFLCPLLCIYMRSLCPCILSLSCKCARVSDALSDFLSGMGLLRYDGWITDEANIM